MVASTERVNHLLIKSRKQESAVTIKHRLEEAFNMASFPSVPTGSLVFIKHFIVKDITVSDSAYAIAKKIEQYFQDNALSAVNIDTRDSAGASAVWLSDPVIAWVRLLETICSGKNKLWYWPLIQSQLLANYRSQSWQQGQSRVMHRGAIWPSASILSPVFILHALQQLYGVASHRIAIEQLTQHQKLDTVLEHIEAKHILPFIPLYKITSPTMAEDSELLLRAQSVATQLPQNIVHWLKQWGKDDIRSFWLLRHTAIQSVFNNDEAERTFFALCLDILCRKNPPSFDNTQNKNRDKSLNPRKKAFSSNEEAIEKTPKADPTDIAKQSKEQAKVSREHRSELLKKQQAKMPQEQDRLQTDVTDNSAMTQNLSHPMIEENTTADDFFHLEPSSQEDPIRNTNQAGFEQAGFHSIYGGIFYLIAILNRIYDKNDQEKLPAMTLHFILSYCLKCKDESLFEALGFDENQCALFQQQYKLPINNYSIPQQWTPYYRRTDFASYERLVLETIKAIMRFLWRNTQLSMKKLIRKNATIIATHTHIDVNFDGSDINIAIRRLGLDCSPGWVPWLAKVITLEYEAETLRSHVFNE